MSEFDSKKIKSTAQAAVNTALFSSGQNILDKSKKIVPIKTGKLAASSYINVEAKKNPSCEVGFSADYAAVVHSKIDYLSSVLESTKEECMQILKRSIEEAAK